MEEMKVFQNSEFGELGILMLDGKEYFPATQCAKVLGYVNPQKAVRDHCKGDGCTIRSGVSVTTNQHGKATQQTVSIKYITEGNLYRLIVGSKLPAAERFERWVFDDVLPTIRKAGNYGKTDMTEIITQTATVICTEMMKQLAPLFQSVAHPMIPERMELEDTPKYPRFRKKPASIIDRLCPELRREVEGMLCDGRHTYSEISSWLSENGIKISTASICRYAKRTGCYATYEVDNDA